MKNGTRKALRGAILASGTVSVFGAIFFAKRPPWPDPFWSVGEMLTGLAGVLLFAAIFLRRKVETNASQSVLTPNERKLNALSLCLILVGGTLIFGYLQTDTDDWLYALGGGTAFGCAMLLQAAREIAKGS